MTTDVGNKEAARPRLESSVDALLARLRTQLRPVLAWGYALIALQLVVRGFVVSGSFYFQDDFRHLAAARDQGLGFVLEDHDGVLEVGQHATVWLLSHVVDGAFWPAATSVLVLQAVVSVLLLQVLWLVTRGSALLLLPLSVFLFTPLALGWSSWWGASLRTLPVQAMMLLAVLALARASTARDRSRPWAVVAVAAHLVGLLFSPEALLILPLLVLVHVLVLTSAQPWDERWRSFRALWPLWAGHLVVLVGYLVVHFTVVDAAAADGRPVDVGGLATTVFRVLVPGLLGGPWQADGATGLSYPDVDGFATVVFALLLAAVVVASWLVAGRGAVDAWLLLLGVLLLELLLLPALVPTSPEVLPRDTRALAETLPVVALAGAAAFTGPGARGSTRPAAELLRSRVNLAVVLRGVAVVVVSCLVTTARLAPETTHEYAHNYTLGVLRQLAQHPERSVVGTPVPLEVAADTDLGTVLRAMGEEPRLDRPSTQAYLFDGLAAMRPLDLLPGVPVTTGPQPGCGWAVGAQQVELGDVPAGARGERRVLRLGYYGNQDAELVVTGGGRGQSVHLPAGLGRAFLVLDERSGPLRASVLPVQGAVEGRVCVTDWAVGLPWVAAS